MMRAFLVLISLVVVCTDASTLSRKKRRLDQMSEMFRTVSGGKMISMMNDYGGWCGLGGAGKPKDKIDRCCMIHDHCYDKLFETACKDSSMPAAPYLLSYNYRIINGRPLCDKESGSQTHCAFSICKCDTAVVKCWMKYLDQYNPSLKSQSVASKLINQAIDILIKTIGSSPEKVTNDTSSSLVHHLHHTVNKTLKAGSSLMSQLSDIVEKTVKAYSEVFLVRKRHVN